ncbi:MAG TPA: SsrA-binding protein SmpB [Candidatus Dependentiae bacterium]|nr:SsrA-binding protein SmpB [Candidatus Dependentiae bacterium]HRQ63070.1 SsrA-binding protein SmpB [Candidatus Dependentiae bacterium]
MKIVAQNKKAFHDYEILDKIEAGIVLTGDEVKSMRASSVSLVGSFAHIKQGELFLVNAHITPYDKAYTKSEDAAKRTRKLLVHKRELNKLITMIAQKGITVVPLKVYFNNRNIAKVELGICKHKKAPDRKKELKEKDIKRETRRALKGE